MGRLVATPLKTVKYQYAEACARDCLSYPATVCLAYNYDYGSDGVCQLLREIEGHTTHVRQVGASNTVPQTKLCFLDQINYENCIVSNAQTNTYENS